MSIPMSDWPPHWDQGCVMCGEPRVEGSEYCAECSEDTCPHCFVVHDTRGGQCDPPEPEPPTFDEQLWRATPPRPDPIEAWQEARLRWR